MADGETSGNSRWDYVQERIGAACGRSGRDPSAITLVGASKRQDLDTLRAAYSHGLRCFGENRVQEADEKIGLLPEDIDWHLIGPLQSNKVKRAALLFSTVHSVDRPKIARLLNSAAQSSGRKLRCFLQINLGNEASKHGFQVPHHRSVETFSPLIELAHLEILGLMAIPPADDNLERSRSWFKMLREARGVLEERYPERVGTGLSMGMSDDFEIAIEEGATHIRLGSILFGPRPG